MRTILATTSSEIERYIISTHQDILVIAQEKNYAALKGVMQLLQPELVIIDDLVLGSKTVPEACQELKRVSADTKYLWLFLTRKPTAEEVAFLNKQNQPYIESPIQNHELSQELYTIIGAGVISKAPATVAIWTPKAGDGATLTAEALAFMLCSQKERIGIFDYNLKAPYLKLRYGFEDSNIIDDLVPYIAGGLLTSQTLTEYSRKVKDGLTFLGGILHPELHSKYNATHFNKILEVGQECFSKIIIDAGSSLDNTGTVTALKNADLILAIMQPNYIAKYSLKEAVRLFPALGINPNKIKLVINRYVPEVSGTTEVIASGLNLTVAGTLPELGAEANIIATTSLFESKNNKKVSAYNQDLLAIMQKVGLYAENDKGKKAAGFPKLLLRR